MVTLLLLRSWTLNPQAKHQGERLRKAVKCQNVVLNSFDYDMYVSVYGIFMYILYDTYDAYIL